MVAKLASPTSMPTALSTAGSATGSASQESVTNHLPVLVRRTQHALISPSTGRWKTALTSPMRDRCTLSPTTFLKSSVHGCLLSSSRIQAVLERFTHTYNIGDKGLKPLKRVKPDLFTIARLKHLGFTGYLCKGVEDAGGTHRGTPPGGDVHRHSGRRRLAGGVRRRAGERQARGGPAASAAQPGALKPQRRPNKRGSARSQEGIIVLSAVLLRRIQHTELLLGAAEVLVDRADRDTQRAGDLGDGLLMEAVQHEHLPQPGR